jgi:hypothetical protein
MAFDKEEVLEQIGDCENRSEKLSDWELNFIDSISQQLVVTGSLSEKQIEILDRIWNKVT